VARKAQFLRDFDQFAAAAKEVLASRYGEEDAQHIIQQMRREVELLIPQLPYIGGKKNRLTESLTGTSASLALFKVLRKRGETTARIGSVHHHIVEKYMSSLPRWRFRLMRAILSTGLGLAIIKRSIKRAAARWQERRYANDFVFRYVEGDGRAYDFGIDYEECAVVKFFRRQGADEFTPYVCLYDYSHSRLAGTGLVRTMTLAEGAETCDFRFRIGREPENQQRTRIEDS
jgi:hypothetical protein